MTSHDSSLRWREFKTPKAGNSVEEYEDACSADPVSGRFAVADGASECIFAGLWARLLTEGFLAAPRPRKRDLIDWVDGLRSRWRSAVKPLDLPWYGEMKREEGAFATFLGLAFGKPTPHGRRWRAVAVGDACLMQVRDNQCVEAFPIRQSSDFGNRPELIGTCEGAIPPPKRCFGSMRPGDRLFLMTDALAQWFLFRHEKGERPWEAVADLSAKADEDFLAWIEQLRGEDLRNDDVTLLVVEPDSASTE